MQFLDLVPCCCSAFLWVSFSLAPQSDPKNDGQHSIQVQLRRREVLSPKWLKENVWANFPWPRMRQIHKYEPSLWSEGTRLRAQILGHTATPGAWSGKWGQLYQTTSQSGGAFKKAKATNACLQLLAHFWKGIAVHVIIKLLSPSPLICFPSPS